MTRSSTRPLVRNHRRLLRSRTRSYPKHQHFDLNPHSVLPFLQSIHPSIAHTHPSTILAFQPPTKANEVRPIKSSAGPTTSRPLSTISIASANSSHRREPAFNVQSFASSIDQSRRRRRDSRGIHSARSASGFEELLAGNETLTLHLNQSSSGSSVGSLSEDDERHGGRDDDDDEPGYRRGSRALAIKLDIDDDLGEEDEGEENEVVHSNQLMNPHTSSLEGHDPSAVVAHASSMPGAVLAHSSNPYTSRTNASRSHQPPSSFHKTNLGALPNTSPRLSGDVDRQRTVSGESNHSLTPRIQQSPVFTAHDLLPRSDGAPSIVTTVMRPTPNHEPLLTTQHHGVAYALGQPVASSSASTSTSADPQSFHRPGGTASSPDIATVVSASTPS